VARARVAVERHAANPLCTFSLQVAVFVRTAGLTSPSYEGRASVTVFGLALVTAPGDDGTNAEAPESSASASTKRDCILSGSEWGFLQGDITVILCTR